MIKKILLNLLTVMMLICCTNTSIMAYDNNCASNCDLAETELQFEGSFDMYYDDFGNVYSEEEIAQLSQRSGLHQMTFTYEGWKIFGGTRIVLEVKDPKKKAQIQSFYGSAQITDWYDYEYEDGYDYEIQNPGGTSVATLTFTMSKVITCGVQYYVLFDVYLYLLNGTPLNGSRFLMKELLVCA